MGKKTFRIEKYIDKGIQVGDIVRLRDGSGITRLESSSESIYIVNAYPYLTGSQEVLHMLDATVVEVGIEDRVTGDDFLGIAYLQDCVIQIGETKFRTASQFLNKTY